MGAHPESRVHSVRIQAGDWRMHSLSVSARGLVSVSARGLVSVSARDPAGRATGSEPPIICVHGVGVSSRYMVPTLEALAGGFPVHAVDLPGFGRSEKPLRILDVGALADALVGWMDASGVRPAILLGNSFGCQVAVECAVRHPEAVSRLVLVGPTFDPAARTATAQVARWVRNMLGEPPSLAPILLRDYLDCGTRRILRTFAVAMADRIEDKLPHVAVPTLVVRGERDRIVPQEWAEEAVRLLPQGKLVVVPGAPHTVNYIAPRRLAQAVRAFVAPGMAA